MSDRQKQRERDRERVVVNSTKSSGVDKERKKAFSSSSLETLETFPLRHSLKKGDSNQKASKAEENLDLGF